MLQYQKPIAHHGPITRRRTATFRVMIDPVGDGRCVPYEFEFDVFDAWTVEAQALVFRPGDDCPSVTGQLHVDGDAFGPCVGEAIANAITLGSHVAYDGMRIVVHARLCRATATISRRQIPSAPRAEGVTLIQYVPTHWQEKGVGQQYSISAGSREELLAWESIGSAGERSPYELRLDELWGLHEAGLPAAALAETVGGRLRQVKCGEHLDHLGEDAAARC